MNINYHPKEGNLIPPYLAAYLIHAIQVGVGVLGYQRIIAKESGHDAWISVLIASIFCHITVWVMYRTLRRYASADLYGIHKDVFGKWLGGVLSFLFMVYSITGAMIVLRNYVEVIQTWMFPQAPTWVLSLIILFLAMYTLLGGIRVIAGYTFLTVTILFSLIFTMYFPLQYARWDYLFPILEADWKQLFSGAKEMSLTIIGFEVFYVLYPYLKFKDRVGTAVQLGIGVTTFLYTMIMLVSLVYFSDGQLMKTIWATLSIQKMVSLPFLERFEYISISLWLFVILPNIMLYVWAAARGCKRVFNWNQANSTYGMMLLIFFSSLIFMTRQQINTLNDLFSNAGMIVAFAYPYVLFVLVCVKQFSRRRRGLVTHETVEK